MMLIALAKFGSGCGGCGVEDEPEVGGAVVGEVAIESRILKMFDVKFPLMVSWTSLDDIGLVVAGFKTTKRIRFGVSIRVIISLKVKFLYKSN